MTFEDVDFTDRVVNDAATANTLATGEGDRNV